MKYEKSMSLRIDKKGKEELLRLSKQNKKNYSSVIRDLIKYAISNPHILQNADESQSN